jgi:hypothetical protein
MQRHIGFISDNPAVMWLGRHVEQVPGLHLSYEPSGREF